MTEPLPRRYLYPLIILFVSVLGLAVGGAIYTNRTADAEGRKLCAVFTLLDSSYRHTPPATPAGKAFATVVHKVVLDLGCEED